MAGALFALQFFADVPKVRKDICSVRTVPFSCRHIFPEANRRGGTRKSCDKHVEGLDYRHEDIGLRICEEDGRLTFVCDRNCQSWEIISSHPTRYRLVIR